MYRGQYFYLVLRRICRVLDEAKQVAISHSIVQSCRPWSIISPVLFGIGVHLDHLYRSKFLVAQLCRLGMCVSYDEITRFKQLVMKLVSTLDHILPVLHNGLQTMLTTIL